jgi:SpoIID/LytB domain protein
VRLPSGFFLLIISLSTFAGGQEAFESTFGGESYYSTVPGHINPQDSILAQQQLSIVPYPTPEIIHVLIFPHIGAYSSPQGRESIVNLVTLESEGPCTAIDQLDGSISHIAGRITLRADELNNAIRIQCRSGTARIIREAGLPSILYRGEFEIKPALSQQGMKFIRIILDVPFEEYLRGVVPSEMPSEWPAEALKAQAVAARSYALFQIAQQRILKTDFDVDDTVFFQAFLGLNRVNPNTDAAILSTRSLVLTYGNKPIQAFFSADSGGYTEAAENVWKFRFPYCPSKPEIYDLNLVKSDWLYESTIEKIESELRAKDLLPLNKTLADLRVSQRSVSGRATEMTALFTDGTFKKIWGPDAQMAMRLKSNLLTLKSNNGKIIFAGKGFGHGVGLNQWGAKALAESKNFSFKQILEFYFKP